MHVKTILTALLLAASTLAGANSYTPLKSFNAGSYQQILAEQANHGFMLVIWSLDCGSCIKDMAEIARLRQSRPDLKIVMLSTDELQASADVVKMLEKYRLLDLENWIFADDNTQKLRYEIDPQWYSELPRTYLFSASHAREGFSGELKPEDYQSRLARLGL